MIEHISTAAERAATRTAFRRLIEPLPLDDFLDRYGTRLSPSPDEVKVSAVAGVGRSRP